MEDFNIRNEFQRLKEDNENKVSNPLFYWVIGIIGAVFVGIVTIFGYVLNYEIYRIEQIDNKHQSDHDKIIKIETQFENIKKN